MITSLAYIGLHVHIFQSQYASGMGMIVNTCWLKYTKLMSLHISCMACLMDLNKSVFQVGGILNGFQMDLKVCQIDKA